MKKRFLLLTALLALVYFNMDAQVTVGSDEAPHSKALLDLKEGSGASKDESSKGLFLPRVNLASTDDFFGATTDHQAGAIVYNRNTSETSVPAANRVTPGFYYNNGTKWEKLYFGTSNWFYMPSIAIDVTISGTFTRDLYLEYRKQFEDSQDNVTDPSTSPTAGTELVQSPDSPNPFTSIFNANQLYYYVTGYDATVFSALTITADGKLTYTVDADNVTDATYMNIVFVEK